MDKQKFGSCTNIGECEAACPKEIRLHFIALMNRDLIRASFTDWKVGRPAAGT
jgi:succinate dehydrogenase / fumarate reductase iron-sulfur subunit